MAIETKFELDKLISVDTATHQKCSVCKTFQAKSSFLEPYPRTNCETCYNTPAEQWPAIEATANKLGEIGQTMENEINQERYYTENSMSVEEMIKALQALPPNSRIFIAEEGTGINGFAYINPPTQDYKHFYKIGLSNWDDHCKYD